MRSSTLTFLSALVAVPAGAQIATTPRAQICSELQYRLHVDDNPRWFDVGQPVELPAGTAAHLYVQVRSRSTTPYLTEARLGTPGAFGYEAPDSTAFALEEQGADDVQHGRIAIRGRHAGEGAVAYELLDVKGPGRLEEVSGRCRKGLIAVHVTGGEEEQGPTVLSQDLQGSGLLRRGREEAALRQANVRLYQSGRAVLHFEGEQSFRIAGTWKAQRDDFVLQAVRGLESLLDGTGLIRRRDGQVTQIEIEGVTEDRQKFGLIFAATHTGGQRILRLQEGTGTLRLCGVEFAITSVEVSLGFDGRFHLNFPGTPAMTVAGTWRPPLASQIALRVDLFTQQVASGTGTLLLRTPQVGRLDLQGAIQTGGQFSLEFVERY
jgi:hypothetical protein